MQIPQITLDAMLEAYKPECRYLVQAELDYITQEGKGLFRIPQTFYTQHELRHLAAVELILCYNQLAYTMFADIAMHEGLPHIGKIPLEQFKQYQLENSFIVRMNNIRFKRPVNASEFQGKIKINKVIPKRGNDLVFFKTEFDIEGKYVGEIDTAFVLNSDKPS